MAATSKARHTSEEGASGPEMIRKYRSEKPGPSMGYQIWTFSLKAARALIKTLSEQANAHVSQKVYLIACWCWTMKRREELPLLVGGADLSKLRSSSAKSAPSPRTFIMEEVPRSLNGESSWLRNSLWAASRSAKSLVLA